MGLSVHNKSINSGDNWAFHMGYRDYSPTYYVPLTLQVECRALLLRAGLGTRVQGLSFKARAQN